MHLVTSLKSWPLRVGVSTSLALGLAGCAVDPFEVRPWTPEVKPKAEWTQGSACIALSGGGIRSAAFSIGVLEGLHDAGLLSKSKYLSATSGGNYAAAWMYSTSKRSIALDEALDPKGKEQQRLASESETFVDAAWGFWSAATGGPNEAISRPIKSSSCYLKSEDLAQSGGTQAYATVISRVFLGQGFSSIYDAVKVRDSIGIGDLPKLITTFSAMKGSIPACGKNRTLYRSELVDGVLKIGNEFSVDASEWKLQYTAAAAGGAIDISTSVNDAVNLCSFPSLLRPLLGTAFCATPTAQGQDKQVFFISDGGFTDNVPIGSLLQRECKTIVAVDATHDPFMKFQDLITQDADDLTKVGWSLDTAIREIKGQDLSSDAEVVFGADKLASPVGVSVGPSKSVFALVKLGIPMAQVNELPVSIEQWHKKTASDFAAVSGCKGSGIGLRCRFPQEATTRQAYFPSEFTAYRDLGHWIAERFLLASLANAGAIRFVPKTVER